MHSLPHRSLLAVALLNVLLLVSASSAAAQNAAPVRPTVMLGAPQPAAAFPADALRPPTVVTVQPSPDTPPVPFLGARYSFDAPRTPCQSFNVYAPGYVAPMFYNPRYREPGPFYYTRSYPYGQTYYNYYYTPGYFRY